MAVRLVKGVQKVDGDAKAKTLTIEFDPQVTSVEAITKAMARAGYEAQEL
jgi:copper chaperone CopZ